MAKEAMLSRLNRWLALVPYYVANPGATYQKAASDLGTTPETIRRDLEAIFFCGLPGGMPGDLIDVDMGDTSAVVTYAAGIDRPLKMTRNEASSLLFSLGMLAETDGQADPAAVLRAIEKIRAAVADADPDVVGVVQASDEAEEAATTATVRAAVKDRRALALRYYTESRDSTGDRTVDPIEIKTFDGRSYLRAWCRDSAGIRMFRLDRIDAATALDEPATVPEGLGSQASLFDDAEDSELETATLRLGHRAAWALEYHPLTVVGEPDADGAVTATMRYADEEWMARFVTGFGGEIAVLAPEPLAAAVVARARAGLANYS
ncbi:WYL domain-containing protein [Tsukamurella sp. 8F]|uniref:helix-turn-helix transcriptional regulator n=1 Tax=unclassified Tsukamurella TaxID=2633480 RepID=UPI0023B95988|nr:MULTISPECIES: WYL domain-containing protein [unclassified Tsukamurella]MDF0530548.1 WYL domain-containing protein [Tsukamurella sp. 8J]MDF0586802.1 WYL domain-containing protein [Tsukamurella sp. 8F]